MNGHIFQINASRGGVPKLPVNEAELTIRGLTCDKQKYPFIHGGPKKALCLYSLDCIRRLQEEGHPIYPGSVGENLTIAGIDWAVLEPGVQLALGQDVVIEITKFTKPCKTIASSFAEGFFNRISQNFYPGESRLYARVIQTGQLFTGATVRVIN